MMEKRFSCFTISWEAGEVWTCQVPAGRRETSDAKLRNSLCPAKGLLERPRASGRPKSYPTGTATSMVAVSPTLSSPP